MEYRNLGSAGAKVSTICLGAMTFGEPAAGSMMHNIAASEETSFAIMDRALEAGVNFLDVADVYGNDGLSERVVGKWLAHSKRRDEVVVATKFRFRMAPHANGTGASRFRIVRAVEDSLRRLNTDRIDLYQVHMQDIETPEEETLRALDDLVTAGKVVYIGCSNYAAYRLCDSLWSSKSTGRASYVTLQAQYHLLSRELEREHVPLCREKGLGILPWSPLAGGILSGKYQRDGAAPEGSRYAKFSSQLGKLNTPRTWAVLDAIHEVAKEVGVTPAQVSLAWLLHKPQVSSVIIGARTVAQLDDNLKASDVKLPKEAMEKLDKASALELGYPYEFISRTQGKW